MKRRQFDHKAYEAALAKLDRVWRETEGDVEYPDLQEAPTLPKSGEQTMAVMYRRTPQRRQ